VTYSVDLVNCDGSTSSIVSTRRCTIPFTTLQATPFSLEWGTSVYAKVTAINVMGSSVASSAGNGAVITREPDAPTNVIN
jgi:hypothetical protein